MSASVSTRPPLSRSATEPPKRAVDVLVAGLLLLALLPVLLLIAAAVATTRGPLLYGHRRVGRGGREFGCLKFRTMVPDADAALERVLAADPAARREWAATRKLRRDPRVTAVGRVLRATSLDELPQLFNVLGGSMSLVGPRPVVREELDEHYGPAATYYAVVRPGITGLWQVSGRSDTSYAERVRLDVEYVRTCSAQLDMRILLRTVQVVLRRGGAY